MNNPTSMQNKYWILVLTAILFLFTNVNAQPGDPGGPPPGPGEPTCIESFVVSGGGAICGSGSANISLDGSQTGVTYQLKNGALDVDAPVAGTGLPLSWTQTAAGNYTVVGTSVSDPGCVLEMDGAAIITVTAMPTTFNVSGGGSMCEGGTGLTITLSGSESGVNYQLKDNAGNNVGTVQSGTGLSLSWPGITTASTYTVIATNASNSSCVSTMSGSAAVTVNPKPLAYNVGGGGTMCSNAAGLTVTLSGSQTGIRYQLKRNGSNVSSYKTGTGAALSWGSLTSAGTYTVVATNATTTCTATMNGSAMIVVNTIPNAYTVAGGGAYCSGGTGVSVTLSNSGTGARYQLRVGAVNVGAPLNGTGAKLTWPNITTAGTHTVVATNITTGCARVMTGNAVVTVNPLPTAFTVSGGGLICPSDPGLAIGLNGSQTGVNYQLRINGVAAGSGVAGTGSALSWPGQTTEGTYTITATNSTTTCSQTMTGNAVIDVEDAPTTFTVGGGGSGCSSSGLAVTLSGSQTGFTYQLKINDVNSGDPVSGTGSPLEWINQTTVGSYTVSASNANCAWPMNGSVSIDGNPPIAPSNLVATGETSSTITLTWEDLSNNEDGFQIERSSGLTSGFSLITTTTANTVSFTDAGLSEGAEYYYRIRAVSSSCLSSFTPETSASTHMLPPSAPAATPASSTSINITWSDGSTAELGFQVERSLTAGGSYTAVAATRPNTLSQIDVGLTPNTTYFYRVRALGPNVHSSYTTEVSATTLGPAPAAPGSLTVAVLSPTSISLQWNDNSTDEENFIIERSLTKGSGFALVATLSSNAVSYTDVNLNSGSTYFYRVKARNNGGSSSATNEASIRLPIDGVNPQCENIYCDSDGGVGIGTPEVPNGYKLAVNGKVMAEGVKVLMLPDWPDYVFQKDYPLADIESLKKYIDEHGHLPNVPDAKTIENQGIDIGEINVILLEKIEEMSLYLIQMEERIKKLEAENNSLKQKDKKN